MAGERIRNVLQSYDKPQIVAFDKLVTSLHTFCVLDIILFRYCGITHDHFIPLEPF